MNVEREIKQMSEKVRLCQMSIKSLNKQYKDAKQFTNEFLQECARVGLNKISIAKSHESIKESVTFPFGASGSVFGIGINDSRDKQGWPAIWGVCERKGLGGGCGNSNQYQVDTTRLIEGVYHFKGGAWKRW
jgi:hypothetical protein